MMQPLSWAGIVRLGLVQTALGAIFVLSTSTLNRVMVVDLMLPAALPGALIALHYAIQILRPRLGYGSDLGGRRTPWIIGGMAVLSVGGLLAAAATGLMREHLIAGIALAVVAFVLIGLGVGAAGTALLVLLAKRTSAERRPAAAAIAWVMMIAGFIVTAAVASKTLDPFSPARLMIVAAVIAALGFLVSCLAVWGIEEKKIVPSQAADPVPFGTALRDLWAEPGARRFAIFIFVSMLAYGGEELLIEPFAGSVFGLTVGQTARLSGMLHAGSLVGMLAVPCLAALLRRFGSDGGLRPWMIGGCIASAFALFGLAGLGFGGTPSAVSANVFALGVANGAYAIAAIGSMMQLVGVGGAAKEGIRMGLWGAAQAVAFGGGGLMATLMSDATRAVIDRPSVVYAMIFCAEALVFLVAAGIAIGLRRASEFVPSRTPVAMTATGRG